MAVYPCQRDWPFRINLPQPLVFAEDEPPNSSTSPVAASGFSRLEGSIRHFEPSVDGQSKAKVEAAVWLYWHKEYYENSSISSSTHLGLYRAGLRSLRCGRRIRNCATKCQRHARYIDCHLQIR